MIDSPFLSVVVPAFNEDGNLARVIEHTVSSLATAAVGVYEIIVVDDGSSDKTGQIADELERLYPEVKVVHHERNQGFGAAIRSGYAVATGRYVTQIPADGEITIEEALGLLRAIGSHDVIASRREREPSVHRDVLTGTFHLLMRILLGFDGSGLDGIFVIRGALLKTVPLTSTTGLVNLETLMRCSRRGARRIS